MKKFLFFFLVSNWAYSQVLFNPYSLKFRHENPAMVFEEVIDSRDNKELLLLDGDSVLHYEYQDSLPKLLKSFLNFGLKTKNKKRSVIAKINEYTFGTRLDSKGKKILWFYADIDFYKNVKNKYVKIYQINDMVEAIGNDSLAFLTNKLHWAFWDNVSYELSGKVLNTQFLEFFDKSQIEVPYIPIKIFSDSTLKDGVYPYFRDVLLNQPEDELFELSTNLKGNYYFNPDKESKFKLRNRIWGVCKNGQIYKAIKENELSKSELMPVARIGNSLELGTIKKVYYSNTKMNPYLSNIILGRANSFFGIQPGFNGIKMALSAIRLISNLTSEQRLIIDMNTGELNPVRIYNFSE